MLHSGRDETVDVVPAGRIGVEERAARAEHVADRLAALARV